MKSMRKSVNLQEHINELNKRKIEIDLDLAKDEVELQHLLALGRNLSEIVEAKRERKQRLDYAIMNIQAVIDLEAEAEAPAAEVDPWGDAG